MTGHVNCKPTRNTTNAYKCSCTFFSSCTIYADMYGNSSTLGGCRYFSGRLTCYRRPSLSLKADTRATSAAILPHFRTPRVACVPCPALPNAHRAQSWAQLGAARFAHLQLTDVLCRSLDSKPQVALLLDLGHASGPRPARSRGRVGELLKFQAPQLQTSKVARGTSSHPLKPEHGSF